MASRYPSGQDEFRYHPSSYSHNTHSSYHSKSNLSGSRTTTYGSSTRSPTRSFVRSPPPPSQTGYFASKTFTNRNYVTDRAPPPDHPHSFVSNPSHRNKATVTSPRYQQSTDTSRGRFRSPRGRQATPPRSEYRHESARVPYRSSDNSSSWSRPSNNRDHSHSQNDWGTPRNSYRSDSDSYSRRGPSSQRNNPVSNRESFNSYTNKSNKSSKPFTRDQSVTHTLPPHPLTEKAQNKPTNDSVTKQQCSICLNDVKDKVSLKCDHSFCYECLVKWCATKETCPLCRSKITELNEMNKSLPNQRMSATFLCECGNLWKSSYAYNGIKQGCKKCKREVAASGQRPLKRTSNPLSSFLGIFPFMQEKESTHKQELCGMCKLLGKDCSRQDTLGEDDDLLDIVGLENLMALFNLSESAMDNGISESDWSNPFSDPEEFVREELGIDLDLYEHLYDDGDFDYDYDFNSHCFDDIEDIDYDPDWENV